MAIGSLAVGFALTLPGRKAEKILAGYSAAAPRGVVIDAPFDGTVFPPDLAAPFFAWHATDAAAETWLVLFTFESGGKRLMFRSDSANWQPEEGTWKKIIRRCGHRPATVTVLGVGGADGTTIVGAASIEIRLSADPVAAPIFYREVNLPFSEAVKDPSRIRWRMGSISSVRQPPVVLDNLPVCGNCHSFSRDGAVLGMDVDYANDKGAYAIARTAPEMTLTPDTLLSWSDFRRADGIQTFGLLSQVSPDGRHVISTVKDRSVFLPLPGLEFSQLFFPIQGILAVHDRQTGEFYALPGADDPAYVQSNPVWSPDGKTIIFARSLAHTLRSPARKDAVLLRREECNEFLDGKLAFRYDLYAIPFNGGKGGKAEPLPGASRNGKSNFFPKYSPDGKWIVFCKAASFMLLQPDSELYIVPSGGGEAKRLACNLSRMNSWHSWSPNGRWLLFASKSGTPFTRLFIAHMDEQGESSPAVLLANFTRPGRAANIPEFVNMDKAGIRRIRERFIDENSFVRAGNAFREGGDPDRAIEQYKKALARNPGGLDALVNLGSVLSEKQDLQGAADTLNQALALAPTNAAAYYNLSILHAKQGNFDEAIRCGNESVRWDPASASAHNNLGVFLLEKGRLDEALAHLTEAIRLDPGKGNAYFSLGRIMVRKGRLAEAASCYAEAVRLEPDERSLNALAWLLATAPDPSLRDGKKAVALATRLCELTRYQAPRALDILGASYAEAGMFPEASRAATSAVECALKQGNPKLAQEISRRLNLYKQGQPFHQ